MTDPLLPPQDPATSQPGQPYSPGPAASQPGQPYAPGPSTTTAAPLSASDDKLWASLAHFGGVIGPLPALLIFLILKDRGPFVRQESKEALNWQITFIGAWIVLNILVAILSAALIFSNAYGVIGLLGWIPGLLWLANIILSILGGVKVNSGQAYRYPVALRLIK
jgi:uncharacterized Tic20 family protein